MNTILQVENLDKQFNGFCLNNVSFSLKEGCITGFIGVNGSGKTTTIKTILGLYTKDNGSILFNDKDFTKAEKEIKNRIGVVLDEGYLYEEMTLKEMKSIIAPSYSNWDETVFLSYIKRFQLRLDQKIATLSKGMRMKFALSLALSHHADLLIMDEPTSGLDPLVRTELSKILLEFMEEEGKSVFFSTHITTDLDKVADMLILIDDGKIVLNESKDDLLDRHRVVKGDKRYYTDDIQSLFITSQQTLYGFEGLTNQVDVVKKKIPDIITERPTIEQVMLAYIGGSCHAI
ncbi:ABC transporter ATP-binding protein [Niallia sp. 01092]|uniref:ABC transporter ATP-binding protein n=1 Tax=unclassified Niallia TaxID=2837522 RepID=UPI003FD2FF1D